jgi:hypothetical protein
VYLKTDHLLCEGLFHSSTPTQVVSGVHDEYETTAARKLLSTKPGNHNIVIIGALWKKSVK